MAAPAPASGADTVEARKRMVERQLTRRGVTDPEVLEAMRVVPREAFVPEELAGFAYEDSPLPIEAGQTISQPYIVGLMIQAAEVKPGDRVLEIGAGSGYAAAVMAAIADRVFAIERHGELTDRARARFDRLGYDNIELRTGDGARGWVEAAPFDAIIASAGAPGIPDALKQQLAVGGRLVIPVGETARRQTLIKLTRTGENTFEQEDLGGVLFVPLIGEQGWSEDERTPMRRPEEPTSFRAPEPATLPERIRAAAEPLPDLDDPAFGALFDRFVDHGADAHDDGVHAGLPQCRHVLADCLTARCFNDPGCAAVRECFRCDGISAQPGSQLPGRCGVCAGACHCHDPDPGKLSVQHGLGQHLVDATCAQQAYCRCC